MNIKKMIYFLDDGKVIIEYNEETYEFIKNTKLAKLMCEKFMLCEGINYYYDKISYVIDDEYVYYDIKTDNIYIWSNLDKNKNISENIIWYEWYNKDFIDLEGNKYDNINDAYINNKLVLLKYVLLEYKNMNDNVIKREESSGDDTSELSSDDISESSSDDVSESSSDDVSSDSDFIVDDSDTSDTSDINVSLSENMNVDTYMSTDNVEYRKEYVSNLINIVNSTRELDSDRVNLILNYYNYYYLNQ
tara:strand:- start:7043 stop:7783 length:741 start_codon:yes stop_codon:yes gene_type:complete